ncbi:MAG: four helix bundle protein [bacterium]
MSQSSHLPIYNSAFFLLKEYYKRVPKFPKQYKYFLGERMIECLVEIIKLVQEANNQKNNYKRVLVIDKIGEKIDELLLYTRIAGELFLFDKPEKKEKDKEKENASVENETSNLVYFFLSEKIVDLSRQNAGWKKYYTPQNPVFDRSEGKEMPPSALIRA